MASKPLSEDQKIEILKRHAAGQSIFEMKKEMGIQNGQQIAGVLTTQYSKTGQYLLKKAGLAGPTMPPKKPRKDLEEGRALAEAVAAEAASSGESSIRAQLEPLPNTPKVTPESVQAGQMLEAPLSTGGNEHLHRVPVVTGTRSPLSTAPSTVVGFRREGTTDKYIVYREEPYKAQVGTFTPPWDTSDIGPRYGDGLYKIERWIPGRQLPEVMMLPVAGYGPPRNPNNYEAPNMNMTPQEPPSAMANSIVNAIKAGAELAKPAPVVPPSPVEPKPSDRLAEKVLEQKFNEVLNPAPAPKSGLDEFLQNWLRVREDERKQERDRDELRRRDEEDRHKRERSDREEQYKREKADRDEQYRRDKADRDEEHKRRLEEADKKHAQELERIKADNDSHEKARQDHEKALAEINNKKIDWAMKKAEEAVDDANSAAAQAEEKLNKKIDELNQTAVKERERDRKEGELERKSLEKDIENQREQLKLSKDFQEQMIAIKQQMASANSDKLIELGERLLNAINDRAKDVLEVKKAEAVLSNNPGLATAAMQNPKMMNQLANAGKPAGDREMTGKLDNVANTQEFRDFVEEWCLHIEDGLDPEVLFDSIQRRYQNAESGVGELVDFMAGRRWPKAKAMIWSYLTPEQRAIFDRENAAPYYEKMRAMIVLMKSSAMKQWQTWEKERIAAPQSVEPPASNEVEPETETETEEIKDAETVQPEQKS